MFQGITLPIFILIVVLMVIVSSKHGQKCNRPGGCNRQNILHSSAKGRYVLRTKQVRHHYKSQMSRSSVQRNQSAATTNIINTRQSANETTQMAVDNLAKDIIMEFIFKEEFIGIHLKSYRDAIAKSIMRFNNYSSIWADKPPTLGEFLVNLSLILDDLKIGSLAITYDLVRLRSIETDPSKASSNFFRGHYNLKHIDDSFIANDMQEGIKSGRYTLTIFEGKQILITNLTENELNCNEANPNQETKPNCNSRLADTSWWGPINNFFHHLQYADLWMIFLEELTLKLESVEIQAEPRINKYKGEFSRWEQAGNLTSENIAEALDRMDKEYNLYSIKNKVLIVASTANGFRLKCLNEIVRIYLKVTPRCSVKDSTAYVVGPYLLMSQVNNCTAYLSMINTSIHYIVAVGTSELYIDDSFVARSVTSSKLEIGKGFHCVLVSPELRVIGGNRNMDLSGRMPPAYTSKSRTEGNPGMPGEEGGRFYALSKILTGGNLKVILNGGTGGKGQDGYLDPLTVMGCANEVDHDDDPKKYICCGGKNGRWIATMFFYRAVDGGKSGLGAPAGQYRTIFLSNSSDSQFVFEQKDGSAGPVGEGFPIYDQVPAGFYPIYPTNGVFEYKKKEVWCTERTNKKAYVKWPITKEGKEFLTGHDGASTIAPAAPIKLSFEPQKLVRGTLKYKAFSRKYSHIFNAAEIYDFISTVDFNETIQNLTETIDLVEEFINSAKDVPAVYLHRELLKLSYKSIATRALAKATNYTGEDKEDNERVLFFVSNAARGRYIGISYPFEPIHVVNIAEFLGVEKSIIQNYKILEEENRQYEHISKTISNYNAMIQGHFKEVGYFINNTINPECDEIEMKLQQLQQFLLDEIKELKKNEEQNRAELEKYRGMLVSHRTGSLVANFLKTIGDAVGAFYPIGGAISAGVDLVTTALNPEPGKPPVNQVEISAELSSGSKYSAYRFRKSRNESLRGLKRQLEAVKSKLNEYPEAFANGLQAISDHSNGQIMQNESNPANPMYDFPPADCFISYMELLKTETKIKEILRNVSLAIKLDVSKANEESTGRLTDAEKDLVNNISMVTFAVLKGVSSGFKDWQQDTDKIDELSKAIRASENKIGALQDHIDKIEEQIIPEMTNLFESLSDTREDLASQSSIVLIVIKHRMQSAIRDIQVDFSKEFVEETGLEAYFYRGLESLEGAMVTLILIYEQLDAHKEQVKMANFTAEVALKPSEYLGKVKDSALQKKFDELRYTLQGDVFIKRQSLVEGAFRQWKFPFVEPALCEYKNLSTTSLDFSTNGTVFKLVTEIENRVNNLIQLVESAKTSKGPNDKYIIKSDFKHTEKTNAFYIWKNSSSGPFITHLLEGRPTFLHSKASTSMNRLCEAIKFNRVSLFFGSVDQNKALDDEFQKVLEDFAVSLTHGGNSFYLFANETFVILGERTDLYFSFELNENGLPKLRNNVYDKLLNADLTLSPYTTWGIELKSLNPDVGFDKLASYAGKFDMYLEGSGSCVLYSFAIEQDYAYPNCKGYGY